MQEAVQAGRPDLHARIMGLEGSVRARMGHSQDGLALVQRSLALALEHNLASAAAEIYQRLADALEHAGDYAGAKETYLTVVLRQTGEWERAITLCRDVLASQDSSLHACAVASGMLGSLYVLRGQPRHAQSLLLEAAALAQQIELVALELLSAWGLALLDELNGAYDKVAERCRFILSRWVADRRCSLRGTRAALVGQLLRNERCCCGRTRLRQCVSTDRQCDRPTRGAFRTCPCAGRNRPVRRRPAAGGSAVPSVARSAARGRRPLLSRRNPMARWGCLCSGESA